MTNKQATEALSEKLRKRAKEPDGYLGTWRTSLNDAADMIDSLEHHLATTRQDGIDEGLEMAAKESELFNRPSPPNEYGEGLYDASCQIVLAIRALKSEKANG